jgi:hypothetical protein
MIDILVASKNGTLPGGLEHAPAHDVFLSSAPGWAAASNALLDQAAARGNDVLFLDDDATLTPSTLALLPYYRNTADVFGFTLLSGPFVASAGFSVRPDGGLNPAQTPRDIMTPALVAHVTTSAIYLSARVVRAGIRFPIWPGAHLEDVAFTHACWLAGFKVAYLPGAVDHYITPEGGGITKSADPAFDAQKEVNLNALRGWMIERDVLGAIAAGVIPSERIAL